MSKTCEDCGNATCVCEGIGKMLTEAKCGTCGRDMNDAYNRLLCREHFTASIAALTSELAEARAERDSLAETRGALTANLNALTVDVATMRAERDEARRALAEAIYERDDALRKKREAQAERDALLDMARDISVYAATSARHGSERSMRDVLTMTASRARSFLLPKRPHKAGEAK